MTGTRRREPFKGIEMKKILIGASVFVVLLGLLLFIGYLKVKKDSENSRTAMEGPGQISNVVGAYRAKYKQWPKNNGDIQKYIENNKEFSNFDLSAYQGLEFTETDKVLTIRYKNYKKGDSSTGPGQMDISIGVRKVGLWKYFSTYFFSR